MPKRVAFKICRILNQFLLSFVKEKIKRIVGMKKKTAKKNTFHFNWTKVISNCLCFVLKFLRSVGHAQRFIFLRFIFVPNYILHCYNSKIRNGKKSNPCLLLSLADLYCP